MMLTANVLQPTIRPRSSSGRAACHASCPGLFPRAWLSLFADHCRADADIDVLFSDLLSFMQFCLHASSRVSSTVLIVPPYFVAHSSDVPLAKIPRLCTFEHINCRRACKWLDKEGPCNTGKSSDNVVNDRTKCPLLRACHPRP